MAYLSKVIKDTTNHLEAITRLYSALIYKNFCRPISHAMKHDMPVVCARFSPDGSRLVTASALRFAKQGGYAQVWDPVTGQPVGQRMQTTGCIDDVRFSPDGRYVVTAATRIFPRPDLRSLGAVGSLISPAATFGSALFASGGEVRVWDAQTGRQLSQDIGDGLVQSARFSADGQQLLLATGRGPLICNSLSGKALSEPSSLYSTNMSLVEQLRQGVHLAIFSPNDLSFLTASGIAFEIEKQGDSYITDKDAQAGEVSVWDAVTRQRRYPPIKHAGRVPFVTFSPSGASFVTCCFDGNAQLWSTLDGKAICAPLHHGGPVGHAGFSSDGRWLVTAAGDQVVRVWDATNGRLRCQTSVQAEVVHHVSFSPDGQWVLSAGDDGTARLWEAATGREASEPIRHKSAVRSAEFSPDGRFAVTASEDGTAQVWEAAIQRPVFERSSQADNWTGKPSGSWKFAKTERTLRVHDPQAQLALTENLRLEWALLHSSYEAEFRCTPAGAVFVMASSTLGQETEIWWELLPPNALAIRNEIAAYAEAMAQMRLAEDGTLERLGTDALIDTLELEEATNCPASAQRLSTWLHNFSPTRTFTPFAQSTYASTLPKAALKNCSVSELRMASTLCLTNASINALLAYKLTFNMSDLQVAAEAEERSRYAINLDPDNPGVNWCRAIVLYRLGTQTIAESIFNRAHLKTLQRIEDGGLAQTDLGHLQEWQEILYSATSAKKDTNLLVLLCRAMVEEWEHLSQSDLDCNLYREPLLHFLDRELNVEIGMNDDVAALVTCRKMLKALLLPCLRKADAESHYCVEPNYVVMTLSWLELLNGHAGEALRIVDAGTNLNETAVSGILVKRAHGLLFSGRFSEAKECYLKACELDMGKFPKDNVKVEFRWRQSSRNGFRSNTRSVHSATWLIAEDFKILRQKNITHPDMDKIEALLRRDY